MLADVYMKVTQVWKEVEGGRKHLRWSGQNRPPGRRKAGVCLDQLWRGSDHVDGQARQRTKADSFLLHTKPEAVILN